MKKRWIIILSIVGILIILRIIAPYYLLKRANKKLDEIKGYNGVVKDIDLALYKGAYTIDSVYFTFEGDSFPEPFMAAAEVEIKIDWNTLFRKGEWVGDVTIENAEINFAVKSAGENSEKKIKQTGAGVKWLKHFRDMSPLKFNQLDITNSTITYVNYTTDPVISFWADNITIHGDNLQNVLEKEEKLPGDFNASATILGGGAFDLSAKVNVKEKPFDMNSNIVIEEVDITEWNELMKVYAGLDFETGVFNLYSEIIVSDNSINGYVKPVIDNLSLLDWDEEKGGFFDKAWEAIAGGISEIFENQKEDQFASRAPLSGNINDVDTDYLTTVWNVFKNAFIDAFDKELEHEINPDED